MGIGLVTNYLNPLWKAAKSGTRSYGNFVLGVEQSDIFSKTLQNSVRGIKDPVTKKYVGGQGFNGFVKNLKEAFKTSENAVKNKSLLTVIKDSFKSIPNEFKAASRLSKIAKTAGGSGKMFGSVLKILGKRMPLIGNVLMVALAVPNIIKAFSQGGVGAGVKEIGKEGAKLGGFAVGAAIGQAIIPIPFVGGLIGGIVGGLLADKIVGKSFTEKLGGEKVKSAGIKAAEAAEATGDLAANGKAQQERVGNPPAQTNTQTPNFTANPSNMYSSNPFASTGMPSFNALDNDYMNKDFMAMNGGLA